MLLSVCSRKVQERTTTRRSGVFIYRQKGARAKGGVVDRQDQGVGLGSHGRIEAEHPIIGVVVDLRRQRGPSQHDGHCQRHGQDGDVPERAFT